MTKTLGTFPIGDYNLKATKDIDGKKFKGALMINMSDDATAYESFKQNVSQSALMAAIC